MGDQPPVAKIRSALARAATSVPTAMAVEIQVDDLLALCPRWTHEQAWMFVSKHGHVLAASAIAGALEAAKRIIEQGDTNAS